MMLDHQQADQQGVMKMPRILDAVALQMAAGTLPCAIEVKAMDDCTVDGSMHK